ncbi:hypothetical protein LDENG_00063520 [Lucifuga dentata]|nr:hypothetical protein LDENG_00063520 [Lucifuga dentata]
MGVLRFNSNQGRRLEELNESNTALRKDLEEVKSKANKSLQVHQRNMDTLQMLLQASQDKAIHLSAAHKEKVEILMAQLQKKLRVLEDSYSSKFSSNWTRTGQHQGESQEDEDDDLQICSGAQAEEERRPSHERQFNHFINNWMRPTSYLGPVTRVSSPSS